MSKVWLVTANEYRDYDCVQSYVVRVCATEEIAEEYIERFKGLHEFNEPEEWDVDAACPELRTLHTITMAPDGTITYERERPCDYDEHVVAPCYDGTVTVRTTQGLEAALKLARDRLVEMKGVQASGS